MKVYSDTLTYHDLLEALPPGVSLFHIEMIPRVRKRHNGWIVSLSGTSPYTSQTNFCDPHKAATWSEHGIWMWELFRRDPDACISWYEGYDEFLAETAKMAAHPGNRIRPGYEAPWLEVKDEYRWGRA